MQHSKVLVDKKYFHKTKMPFTGFVLMSDLADVTLSCVSQCSRIPQIIGTADFPIDSITPEERICFWHLHLQIWKAEVPWSWTRYSINGDGDIPRWPWFSPLSLLWKRPPPHVWLQSPDVSPADRPLCGNEQGKGAHSPNPPWPHYLIKYSADGGGV